MSEDVEAIENLVSLYPELLDAGRFEEMGRLFERATVRMHDATQALRGAAAVQKLMDDAVHLYDGIPATRHLVSNLIVEVDDDGRSATARSYYTAFQARPELPLQPILVGRWHDRFEKLDDRWWFVDRVIYTDLVGDLRFHIKGVSTTA